MVQFGATAPRKDHSAKTLLILLLLPPALLLSLLSLSDRFLSHILICFGREPGGGGRGSSERQEVSADQAGQNRATFSRRNDFLVVGVYGLSPPSRSFTLIRFVFDQLLVFVSCRRKEKVTTVWVRACA